MKEITFSNKGGTHLIGWKALRTKQASLKKKLFFKTAALAPSQEFPVYQPVLQILDLAAIITA